MIGISNPVAKTAPRGRLVLLLAKVRRGISRFVLLATESIIILLRYGPRYLVAWRKERHHREQERLAISERRRDAVEHHLAARLNLSGCTTSDSIKGLFGALGCVDLREITHALLQVRGEELARKLRFLSVKEVSDFYRYYRYFGDFRLANFFREALLHAHIRTQRASEDVSMQALAAAMELGDTKFIIDCVGSRIAESDRELTDCILPFANVLRGEISKATQIWKSRFSFNDWSFCEAVRDRHIAVVGPAPNIDEFRRERSEFDLVVRTNFDDYDCPDDTKADISYYNKFRISSRANEIAHAAQKLKWMIASRGDEVALKALVPLHRGVRSARDISALFLHANPLAIPIILADLVQFQPKRIKVFGVDFFASPASYGSGYHRRSVGFDTISHSLRIHDPFSSFVFIRHLHTAGLCEMDTLAADILQLDRCQYAARLQLLYGAHFVANKNPKLESPNG